MNCYHQQIKYIYYQNMSEADIDTILKKYDRSAQKPHYLASSQTSPHVTDRKKQPSTHLITFMDNTQTATKQKSKQTPPNQHQSNYNYHHNEELLRQLDEAENKLAISERNYVDVCRKYEKLRQGYEMVSGELEKERKARLQELIDMQNKLGLLEADNQKSVIKLESKDHTITLLKQKLSQKEQQARIFQIQLQNISMKLCQTLQLKNRSQSNTINNSMQMTPEQAHQSLQCFRQKYQKIIQSLNSEISNFNKDLLQKQKQKKKLLTDMQQLSKSHIKQLKDLKQILAKNQEQYKVWLDESKKEKLELIQKYQQQVREMRKLEFMEKLGKSDQAIDQTAKFKAMIKEMEDKNLQLQNQVKRLMMDMERNGSDERESQVKNVALQQELKHLKAQYLSQLAENKKYLMQAKEDEEKLQKLRMKYNKNEIQLQSFKLKAEQSESQIKQLKKQLQNLKSDMGKQLKSLINIKKQLNEATNNELNMNSMLTHATTKLQHKIKSLEAQLQSVTTELYAERLEKAKLAQELEETKVELKRQYELSLQNTRRELQQQIKQNLNEKTDTEIQKQKLYLKMFKLQRQYELLKSEVVTSEQMLKMGTKMSKFYQKRVK